MNDFTSICIPTYNNPDDVERLLRSIAEQTFHNYEVIVSDDSNDPEDGVGSVCGRWSAAGAPLSGKLRYFHNDSPLGTVFNWNHALRFAQGDFIKIMFSDDWFTRGTSLESFVDMLRKDPDASLAFSGSRQVLLHPGNSDALSHVSPEMTECVTERCAPQDFIEALRKDWRHLFTSNQIGAPSAVIYRRSLPGCGDMPDTAPVLFDEKSGFASDVFLYMDILHEHPSFSCTADPLISIGLHEKQYTETFTERDERIYTDYRYMYDKYGLSAYPKYRRHMLRSYLIPYGKDAAEARSCGIGKAEFRKAQLDDFSSSVRNFIKSRTGRSGS